MEPRTGTGTNCLLVSIRPYPQKRRKKTIAIQNNVPVTKVVTKNVPIFLVVPLEVLVAAALVVVALAAVVDI